MRTTQNQNRYLPLQAFGLLLLFSFIGFSAQAQLFKRIIESAKANVENKATDKVNEKINKGIDSITKKGTQKKSGKKNSTEVTDPPTDPPTENSANADSTNTYNVATDSDEPANTNHEGPQDGYISLLTSANNTFPGGSIILSGESVFYGKYNLVALTIQGPYNEDDKQKPIAGYAKQVKQITLDKEGKFKTLWNVGSNDGMFILTATSSDGKAKMTKRVMVNTWPDMGDIADSNITQTKKVYENLVKRVEEVKPAISAKDAADLDKKMADIKDRKDAAIILFTSINAATKKLGTTVGKGKGLPPNLSANLTELSNTLAAQASDMARLEEFNNHEPTDNTICEHLVMVKEACAAFSTITNVTAGGIKAILSNITLDKGVPAVVGMGTQSIGTPVDPDKDAVSKESGKLFATAFTDANSLTSKLSIAGIAGDLATMASDYLLKKYCGTYEGTIKHNYTVIFRNADHAIWWKYGVEMEAAFSLRYPKDKTGGRTIKMKGNMEGNATKFTFFADALQAVKDEMHGRDKFVKVVVLKDFLPPALPFASSQHDKLGFGAVARAVTTPSYFNLPVDAEYNTDAETIKLFINPALVDFSPAVENREIYMVVAVLPMIRWMEYPIFKAYQMIKGSFKEKNEFPMSGGKTAKPQCNDKAIRHIGKETDPFEIFLNSTISIQKQ